MDKQSRVHAPYNFVPFSQKKPLFPYASSEELPGHDALRPDLFSGELRITMTAETPVFVSDGGKPNLHFFRLPNGEYAIPGSTLRGMARENMQILGFGLVRPGEDLEDLRVYFREMASAKDSVDKNTKDYYRKALDVQTRRDPETKKSSSLPARVRAGYLCGEAGGYRIIPTKEPVYRVPRKHLDQKQFGGECARTVPVGFRAGEGRVHVIIPEQQIQGPLRLGVLLYTGPSVGKKQNAVYLFPEPDERAESVAVSKADVLNYRADLEYRHNALKGLRARHSDRDESEWLSFWELPKEGERKPVFYAEIDGHCYFGMTRFLRIGYPHTLAEGLPKSHLDQLTGETVPLDFPHAILGFAEKTEAYRSRVSFGDLTAAPGAKEMAPVSVILGEPRPGYYPGYVRDGKDYTMDDFKLRGFKQYWLKEVLEPSVPEGKDQVKTALRPLPKGTAFRGTVRFRNLTKEELGLLLWSLRLEEDCFQTLGMGKPYGYGRMRLRVERLKLLDLSALYGANLSASPRREATDQIPAFIRAYDDYAAKRLYLKSPKKRPSVTSLPEIQDFFYMKRVIRSGAEVGYMELEEYKNTRDPLPTVEDVRTAPPPQKTQETPGDMDGWMDLLRKKNTKL